jgi:hypothetical protein
MLQYYGMKRNKIIRISVPPPFRVKIMNRDLTETERNRGICMDCMMSAEPRDTVVGHAPDKSRDGVAIVICRSDSGYHMIVWIV